MLYLELKSKVFNSMKLNDRLETFYYRLLKKILSNSMRNMSYIHSAIWYQYRYHFSNKTMQLSMPLFFAAEHKVGYKSDSTIPAY